MAFGITDNGFVKKDLTTIKEELETEARKSANFGQDVDLSSFSPIGVFIGLMSGKISEKWEILEDLYYSLYIDTATGVQLERAVALRGVSRNPETSATVTLQFTGTDTTIIPIGTICQTAQGIQFSTIASGVISGTTGDVTAQATTAGISTNVTTGSITTIVTPVAGITAVTNLSVAIGGSDVETDSELRLRYKNLVGSSGASAPVIQLAFEAVAGIITASVLENNTDLTVGVMTPHSIRAIIEGGTDPDIFGVFKNYKLTGIETIGTFSVSGADEKGINRTYKFDRPTNVDIYVEMDITVDTSTISIGDFTTQYSDAIKQAITTFIGGTFNAIVYPGQGIGFDIEAWALGSQLDAIPYMQGEIPTRVGKTALPTADRVDILADERGITDTTKILLSIT